MSVPSPPYIWAGTTKDLKKLDARKQLTAMDNTFLPPMSSTPYLPSRKQTHICEMSTLESPPIAYENLPLTRLKTSASEKINKLPQEATSPAPEYELSSLKPVDGGFSAWRFIIIAFLVEGFVWGLPLSFGVFLNFSPYTEMRPSLAALNGTMCTGMLYCLGSIIISFLERNPKITFWCPTVGTLICSASLLCASYSSKAWQLLLTQGFLYGIGGSLLYYPALLYLSEWWVVRRGFAGSIMFAGTAVFGLIYPPLLDWSLKKYGTPLTLRGLGVAYCVGMLPFLPFFRGRFPLSKSRRQPHMQMASYIKTPIFWAFVLLNLVQSL